MYRSPTKICPYERAIERMRLRMRVDFPDPVRPTTPTFYPYLMVKFRRLRRLLFLPLFFAEKFLNYMDLVSKGKGVGPVTGTKIFIFLLMIYNDHLQSLLFL
jgi:hypothetical protein